MERIMEKRQRDFVHDKGTVDELGKENKRLRLENEKWRSLVLHGIYSVLLLLLCASLYSPYFAIMHVIARV